MPSTSKKLFQLTPRDWRDSDEVIARSSTGAALIAYRSDQTGDPPSVGVDGEPDWRRLFVEVEGDPAEPSLRDVILHALGIGRPRG